MGSRNVHILVCVLVAAALVIPIGVVGGPSAQAQGSEKAWTIMMYWDADNSLEFCTEFAVSTWEESLPSNENINIVALIDLLSSDGVWIYDIVDGKRHLVETWPEMNTSDPATLKEFVLYCMDSFPAEKNMLVLQDHGYGWRGICQDETNGDVLMPMDGIANALESVKAEKGKGIDLLAFDACNMMSIEGVYELRNAVSYVVGSETMVPFDGLPYRMFISDLVEADGDISPADLATNIVYEYVLYYSSKWDYKHIMRYSQDFATMSAFDMSKMAAVGDTFAQLTAVLEPIITDHRKLVEEARGYALVGTWTNMAGYEWMPDAYTFIEGLGAIPGHPELVSAVDAFESAFDAACVAEAHSKKYHDTVHGLSIWFPPSFSQYNMKGYAWARQFIYEDVGLDLVAGSHWYDCLMTYYSSK